MSDLTNENRKAIALLFTNYMRLVNDLDLYKQNMNVIEYFETYSFFKCFLSKQNQIVSYITLGHLVKLLQSSSTQNEYLLSILIKTYDSERNNKISYKDFVYLTLSEHNKDLKSQVAQRKIIEYNDQEYNRLLSLFVTLIQKELEVIKVWININIKVKEIISFNQLFYYMDMNQKGYLDILDIYYFVQEYDYHIEIDSISGLFTRLDNDKNGKISLSDFDIITIDANSLILKSEVEPLSKNTLDKSPNKECLIDSNTIAFIEYIVNSVIFDMRIEVMKNNLYQNIYENKHSYKTMFNSLSNNIFFINYQDSQILFDNISLLVNQKEKDVIFNYLDSSSDCKIDYFDFFSNIKPSHVKEDLKEENKEINVNSSINDLRTLFKYILFYSKDLEEYKNRISKEKLVNLFYFISNMKTYFTSKELIYYLTEAKVDLKKLAYNETWYKDTFDIEEMIISMLDTRFKAEYNKIKLVNFLNEFN